MCDFETKRAESLNNLYDSLEGISYTSVAGNLSSYLFFSIQENEIESYFTEPGGGKALSSLLLPKLDGYYDVFSKTGICLSKYDKITLGNDIDTFLKKNKMRSQNESDVEFINALIYILLVQKQLNK